jgi:hypothetical protein
MQHRRLEAGASGKRCLSLPFFHPLPPVESAYPRLCPEFCPRCIRHGRWMRHEGRDREAEWDLKQRDTIAQKAPAPTATFCLPVFGTEGGA